MLASSTRMRRWLADPRVRVLFLILLFFVVFALAWHLVGMADHSTEMIGGVCFTVLLLGLLVVPRSPALVPVPLEQVLFRAPPSHGTSICTRHPPDEGVSLLM